MNLYKRHRKRKTECLDGLWSFSLNSDFTDSERIAVPCCWDATLKFSGYRGRAWYKRELEILESGFYRLAFNGIANSAKVSIDGRIVCNHYGPHTRFYTDVMNLESGMHELIIEVDNSFGEHNTLMEQKCGWRCFGGIHRSVFLERLPGVFIDSVHVSTKETKKNSAKLSLSVKLRNISDKDSTEALSINIQGKKELLTSLAVPAYEFQEYKIDVLLEDIKLWNSESPDLYFLKAETEKDDMTFRFGIRTFECSEGKILLNGKEIFIKGINHHDYQPLTGYTQTLAQMKHDMDIIKSTGCNLIRTSHYPKDELFLDLCDEMGVLVWSEATGWQNTPEMMTKPLFEEQCALCIDEMIGEQFNHPSIMMWGLLNEVRSEYDEARPVMSRLISRIRELDPSRPVTFATNRLLHNKDRMLDLVDIISPNLYTGWYKDFYGEEAEDLDEAGYFDKLLKWFDEEGLSGKPVLVGEFGAGGIAGFHSFAKERWSEEFQADILDRALDAYTRHPRCAGAIVWLFSDTLCSESEGLYRPYSHNCKGIVDAYRRPKAAYGVVKGYFNAEIGK